MPSKSNWISSQDKNDSMVYCPSASQEYAAKYSTVICLPSFPVSTMFYNIDTYALCQAPMRGQKMQMRVAVYTAGQLALENWYEMAPPYR